MICGNQWWSVCGWAAVSDDEKEICLFLSFVQHVYLLKKGRQTFPWRISMKKSSSIQFRLKSMLRAILRWSLIAMCTGVWTYRRRYSLQSRGGALSKILFLSSSYHLTQLSLSSLNTKELLTVFVVYEIAISFLYTYTHTHKPDSSSIEKEVKKQCPLYILPEAEACFVNYYYIGSQTSGHQ